MSLSNFNWTIEDNFNFPNSIKTYNYIPASYYPNILPKNKEWNVVTRASRKKDAERFSLFSPNISSTDVYSGNRSARCPSNSIGSCLVDEEETHMPGMGSEPGSTCADDKITEVIRGTCPGRREPIKSLCLYYSTILSIIVIHKYWCIIEEIRAYVNSRDVK